MMEKSGVTEDDPKKAEKPNDSMEPNDPKPANDSKKADQSGKSEAGEDQSKRSRLPWKKREIPGGLWLKCGDCGQTIYRKELETREMVCPSCQFHFTLKGRERIIATLDEGSFEEMFADLTALDRLNFQDRVPYAEKIERTVKKTGQNEALLCGRGKIHDRSVMIAVLDFSFMGGSMGEVVGEKISLAVDMARKEHLPVIIFTSSGGARMHEGMLSLMQMAKTSAALASLNEEGGFSVCVMTNPTTGGVTASFASVCDLTLSEPGALIGFAGPRVIATTLKVTLPDGFQRAEFLMEKGQLDMIVPRHDLRDTLARLIDFGRGAWDADGIHPVPAPLGDSGEAEADGNGAE